MNGEITTIDGTFSNGLTRPGDKNGPIKEWIHCRCTLSPFLMPIDKMAPEGALHFRESDLVDLDLDFNIDNYTLADALSGNWGKTKINTVDEVLSEFIKYCGEIDCFSDQIENIFEMYSETYADIMSIKMLDLNFESYIKIVTDSVKDQIIAKKYNKLDFVFLRIFICSYASKIMDKYVIKKDDSYEDNVAINIEKYYESYMKYIEKIKVQPEEVINIKWDSDYFEYPVMAADLIKYLESCLKMFDDILKNDEELSKFKEMYTIFSGNDNVKQLKAMDQLITEYKYKINIDIYNAHKN